MELPAESWLTFVRTGRGAASEARAALSGRACAGVALRMPIRCAIPRRPCRARAVETASRDASSAVISKRRARPPAAGARGAGTGSRRGGKAGTQDGGSISAAAPPWPGQLHSPRFSSQTWVREGVLARDIQVIERQHRAEPNPCTNTPSESALSARAPDISRVPEPEGGLGRFGEVEFTSRDVWATVDDGNSDGAPVIAQGHHRAAGERLVGHAERGARQRATAGERSTATVPGGS